MPQTISPKPNPTRSPAPLDYRRPGALKPSKLDFTKAVRTREAKYQAAAWTMLLVGLPALLVAPLLAASIISGVQRRVFVHAHSSWWTIFAVAAGAFIPLSFWFERRTRGGW